MVVVEKTVDALIVAQRIESLVYIRYGVQYNVVLPVQFRIIRAAFLSQCQKGKVVHETLKHIAGSPCFSRLSDVGMPYWDIEGVDLQGNEVRLSDVVERHGVRYVLLDMWASWCAPCREEIPNLVSQYARFRDNGFEIYGMSFDGNRESWSNTVENYGMTWANVMAECPDGPRSSKVWAEYGMLGVPWNYLIDASTGDIVAKNLHGDELVAKLESLFGMD